jgi:hypothetical protein
MKKRNPQSKVIAPNGQLVSPCLHQRLMAFKPIIEQANAERITRSDLAGRLVWKGHALTECSAYKYVELLAIAWHHQQPYRKDVCREKLMQIVPPLIKKGWPIYKIAPLAGCSKDTVGRFCKEAQLVADGKRYTPKLRAKSRLPKVSK